MLSNVDANLPAEVVISSAESGRTRDMNQIEKQQKKAIVSNINARLTVSSSHVRCWK